MKLKMEVLKSTLGDNYFYLIWDAHEKKAGLIDPVDGDLAVARVKELGLELVSLINTHFHPDHVSGNPTVLAAFPDAEVVAPAEEIETIEGLLRGERGVDRGVVGGDVVEVGGVHLDVIDTPGHTPSHISLRYEKFLFSGDTIFVAGAGNCRFGGDPRVLFETYRDVLRNLPKELEFFPGHDYAVRNAEFLLSIEPEQEEAERVLEEAKAAQRDGRLMTSTLGREQKYNAFFRFDDPKLHRALKSRYPEELEEARSLSESEEEAVFRCVRSLRNSW